MLKLFRGGCTSVALFCTWTILLLIPASPRGEIIPADRRTTWQGNVGIPGGIPNRTTIWCNVKTSIPGTALRATGNGSTDDRAAIQYALDNCPSNQVIYIPTGTYRVSATLVIKNGYTIRGDGTNTVIDARGSGDGIFNFGTINSYEHPWYPTPQILANITAGSQKGSTTVTLSTMSGVAVGKYLMVDCLNDASLVSPTGNEGTAGWNSRLEGARSLRQIVEVTAINGSDVTFTPPLHLNYSNSPQAIPFSMGLKYAGI